MKKYLMMFGTAGLLAAIMMVTGCGSSSDDTTPAATTTTTSSTTTSSTTTSSTTTTTLPPASQVNVSAAGTSDASTAVRSYVFAAGTYTYTIAGFGAGDKLTFPAGVAPTVLNTSFTDGNVTVQWALNGQVISVVLTGLSANDSSLNFVADFNTVFGAGTIN